MNTNTNSTELTPLQAAEWASTRLNHTELMKIYNVIKSQISEKNSTQSSTSSAPTTCINPKPTKIPLLATPVAQPLPTKPQTVKPTLPTTTDNEYTLVTKRRRPNSPTDTYTTPTTVATQNRFTALTHETPSTLATTDEPENTDTTQQSTKQSVPPFIIRDKQNWSKVSKYLADHHAHFTKATNTRDGISVYTNTEAEYRHMYQVLEQSKTPFHTYQLRSEKSLRVVIRGLPQQFTLEHIHNDLTAQHYTATKLTRLNGRDNRPAPLVMVELDKQYKSIYNLQHCCGLTVTVESKRILTGSRQCHKCQLYGHTQPNCHAQYKCMKCAGPHSTHECTKPNTIPAKCANCGGEHPSTFSQCPQNPNKNISHAPPQQQQQPQIRPSQTNNNQNFSYSHALRGPQSQQQQPQQQSPQQQQQPQQNTNTQNTSNTTFSSVLGDMLTTLFATNANKQQISDFVDKSQTLYRLYTQK